MKCLAKRCLLTGEVSNVVRLSGNLTQAIRRLRKNLAKCSKCDADGNCPLKIKFNQDVQTAITQVTDEWNLGPEAN